LVTILSKTSRLSTPFVPAISLSTVQDYWQADEMVSLNINRLTKAKNRKFSSPQCSCSFQLAKYQALTLHILQSAMSDKKKLTIFSLANIRTLYCVSLESCPI